VSKTRTPKPNDALRRSLSTVALVIGAVLPVAIAFLLVAASDDGENPLDRIPDYEDPLEETVVLPFDRGEALRTQYRYHGAVRIVIEGSGQPGGAASRDVFYLVAAAGETALEPPQLAASALAINGEPALSALGLADDPPPFAPDHVYTGIYDAGSALRYLTFRLPDDMAGDSSGQFTITVIQLE